MGGGIYEVSNAQAAFDAVAVVERTYTPDEITGLAVISREGPDDRDHLYLCAASENPPNGRIDGVEEFLEGFGADAPSRSTTSTVRASTSWSAAPRSPSWNSSSGTTPATSRSTGPKAAPGSTGPDSWSLGRSAAANSSHR